MTKTNFKGVVFLTITALIWGGGFVSQFLGGQIIPPFTYTATRTILGLLTIFLMIIISNFIKYKKILFFINVEDKKYIIKNSLKSGVILFIAMVIQQASIIHTETAKAGFISSLYIVFVPIISFIFMKKQINFKTWIFIFTTFVGVLMLSLNSVSSINRGDIICFISMLFYTLDIIYIAKLVDNIDGLKLSFFRFVTVFVLSSILAFIFEFIDFKLILVAKWSIVYTGVLSIGFAYTFQILGQKNCDSIIASLIMSFEGMFAAIFGVIFLHQYLNFKQLIGCIIMTISIILVQVVNINAKNRI